MDFKEIWWLFFASHLNIPYSWGGDDPGGYDCSGIAQEAYGWFGIDPKGDQTALGLYNHFRQPANGVVLKAWEAPAIGDAIFFGRHDENLHIGHVAIAVNDWQMFEEGGGGSATVSAKDAARDNAFARIRPIIARHDLMSVIRPKMFIQKGWSNEPI